MECVRDTYRAGEKYLKIKSLYEENRIWVAAVFRKLQEYH